ncbi:MULTISPECIES: recombinase family protein [Campylobacter]|uniref:Resolvase n=1 Tax=Campylobacter vulpis TaxID=1655500 RepID=A0A2G4R729_9BACT|nr:MULTISPECIES: recombinase family protein [Campylobacter]EAW7484892.1 resolvase [Campylobacter jejuni]EAJ5118879.1 resolvase [Campylobacter upsaliensis]EAK7296507.1 resolvase [Campylobacter upsaliensis]EAL3911382.1 resolvase [Campylobacter upsaliensis]EAL9759990.1 resolvase [Campylobacter upsaliensis]
MVIAYVRVSTNKQDTESQKLEIHEYCYDNNLKIDKILSVEISATKSQEKRKIVELKNTLQKDDTLIATELSRLGRDMFEILNLVLELNQMGVKTIFLRQKELCGDEKHSKLILAIYAYLAEEERKLIAQRTKSGLEKAKAQGKRLGRPHNTLNSKYDKDTDKIKELLSKKVPVKSIWKILYEEQGRSYDGLLWFCKKRNLI